MASHQVDPNMGLTQAEVNARIQAGQHNLPMKPLTKSIGQIISGNTFTLFNLVNVVLGALIFTTGSYQNLLFLGVAIINTAIGSLQEINAKRKIDKMSILAESNVRVRREGKEVAVPQENIVQDDIVLLRRGDQIPVDGVVAATEGLEADESPLTGESDPINKRPGDQLLSGSFIVAGQAAMQVTAVGSDTFAAKLAQEAKEENETKSQLLATINRIIRVLTYVLIPLGLILFTVSMVRRGNYNRAIITTAASMIGMIPEGLVLLTNVALAVSSRNLANRHVLVRALPAIEALARVDTICLDKTGTITSGKLKVAKVIGVSATAAQVAEAARRIAYALNDDNETAMAIKATAAAPDTEVTARMPFSSARKWSGASFADGENLVMGAPQFVFPEGLAPSVTTQLNEAMQQGYRVLAVARTPRPLTAPLEDAELLGLLLISDELRPTAAATFNFFAGQGVSLKVISGDDPVTVANVAKAADLAGADQAIDMSTVAEDADFHALAAENNVFGRVTPGQKKKLIAAMQDNGHTVAMTGDGVNDVLALRQANCSIAMASGAEAAKSIADFVLIDSNFDAMTWVLNEGRRVINNIERVASMYLVKTIFSVILTAIFIFLPLDYPIVPINLTPVSAIAVAIPSFFLTLEPNFERVRGQFMQKVMTLALPAALMVVAYALILTFFESWFGWSFGVTSTLVALLIGVIELHVLTLVARPFNRYKTVMVIGLYLALFAIFFFGGKIFSMSNLWDFKLMLVYIPLIVSTVPVYYALQELLGRRVLSRINWR
ncbi:cation-translocating P-type ATPase [Lacticaseibacillus mingshuiensis]|uniref:cation-translocating P-type ATPase n=1 Tax=Lacticaseibacillus mingshuiensis TaxID=2799574 RepID=UPI00194E089B|nr:cation-translocating P-type ATPase [Lacticaseibacillus mingshuiensis]